MKFIIIAVLLATAMAFPVMREAPRWINKKSTLSKNLGKSASNIKWTDCDGTGTKYIQVNDVKVSGDFKAGGSLTITGTGTSNQDFSVYSVDLTAVVSGIKIFGGVVKLESPQHFSPGPAKLTVTKQLPITPPNGNYKVTAKVQDKSGHELQCFLITFTIA